MGDSIQQSNSRIAKNSIIIYIRMIVVVLVSLITTRYVLLLLGVSDYGLYTVVGGLIGMLNFVSAAMSTTTSRFINYEMGKTVDGNPNKVFNICLVIHILFALLLILLAETLGVWYVNNVLSVEPGKERDAMLVFQMSTIIACIGMINVPYQSLLVAYEKFSLAAGIDIAVTFIKLAFVLALFVYKGNSLMFYSVSMCAVTFSSFFLYHYISYRKWPSVIRFRLYKDKKYYKEILSFNNYNLLSTVAIISRNQGSNLIINYYFGTSINGSFSIARSVQSLVDQFTSNLDQASGPQLIQSYSRKDENRSYYLTGKICRFSLLLYLVVVIPLLCEMEFLLGLWLKNIPEGAIDMCYCILLVCLISATSSGLGQLINAIGKVKWFKIELSFFYLMCLPIGFYMYKSGAPAYTILLLFVGSDVLSRIVQLLLLKHMINFDILGFVRESYLRPLFISLAALVYFYTYSHLHIDTFFEHLLGLILSLLFALLLVVFIGMNKNERVTMVNMIKSKIKL